MKLISLIAAALVAVSPPPGFDSAVLVITGASCMEDLDESLLERFHSLEQHPLDLNAAGRSRLLSSGLLNAFQAASLLEYRQQTGISCHTPNCPLSTGSQKSIQKLYDCSPPWAFRTNLRVIGKDAPDMTLCLGDQCG